MQKYSQNPISGPFHDPSTGSRKATVAEIDLLCDYPRSKRPIEERGRLITEEHRSVARRFGVEYFDGDRLTGYGGYGYHPRFWQATVRRLRDHYGLGPGSSVLDVGCAKGYMLYDLTQLVPGLTVRGIDVSPYAIERAHQAVRPYVAVGDARQLPFADKSFDLVVSINTLHNLPLEDCKRGLREVQRVGRGKSFITVDAWRNEEEKRRLLAWNLTALTYMHVDEWKRLFDEVGYTGDYHWFIAS
ncbi:MAG: Ubiquinone/menaquinone biosynthesis C-methyltransferase UbiE [Candidatus Omnitrophica bacterium]|nr:Ubiquinone/menaquinone biosynthesis C-methyltransferase UbiE [Candidatus Omnitrophota bacterium]